jgi:hypothetical protein
VSSDNEGYFKEIISDPIVVVFFEDKVVIVRANGEVIERELYVSPNGLSPEDWRKVKAGEQYWATLGPGNVVVEEGTDDPDVPNLGGYQPGPLRRDMQPVRRQGPEGEPTQS